MEEKVEVAYFPVWRRYKALFQQTSLTDAQLGKLFRYMLDYQFEGKEPETVHKSLLFAWPFIQKDLDDARRQYETSVRNGRKGGRPKKEPVNNLEKTQEKPANNLEKGKTRSRSKTRSKSMSRSDTDTGSAPACEEAGVALAKKSYGEFGWIKLTAGQYAQLEKQMGASELARCITYVDEAAQTTGNKNRWKDWYLLLRRCHEQHWYEDRPQQTRQIPCGATGELGQAELEAIRQLMAEP